MVFDWSLSDIKSPQVSRALLSILADLSNAVLWIVSARTLISKSSSPLRKPFGTDPSAPAIIGITFLFHNFFLVLWYDPRTSLSFCYNHYFTLFRVFDISVC